MNSATTSPFGLARTESHVDPMADLLSTWIRACDDFQSWERANIIQKHPTSEALAEHKTTLKWMLRLCRILQSQVNDPEFPAREFAPHVAGKLLQLQESWSLIHEAMGDEEADRIIRTAFPDESGTRNTP